MIGRLALIALLATIAACARPGEKTCREPVFITILVDGATHLNDVAVSIEEITSTLDAASAKCGGIVDVFLRGYGGADRETTDKVLAAIAAAESARIVGLPALGDDQ